MTKHDYLAALDELNKWNLIDATLGHKAREFRRDKAELFLECNLQTIRQALKLAAIVTGEPSEGMIIAGKDNFDLPKNVDAIFDAMIAEAQREAEEK